MRAASWRSGGWARAAAVVLAVLVGAVPAPAAARDPEPGTPAWFQRDAENMVYATGRLRDQYANPAFHARMAPETLATYADNVREQLAHPDDPMLTLVQWIPGATAGDPYRQRWGGARGIQLAIEYRNRYGARITGHVWAPRLPFRDPVTGKTSNGPFPGVAITTGSIQAAEEMYWWAAQGLAEAGYVVMTYDVQGQGQSGTFGRRPDGSLWCGADGCPGVPAQQLANFVEGTEDALDWFLSPANPLRGILDPRWIGLAGHSLGAAAVTQVGNRDPRVDAVVAWDNANLGDVAPRVPTMGQNGDYFFFPTPTVTPPDPDAKGSTYRRFVAAGVPAMQVAIRGTHLEWAYVPLLLPASSKGERVAMYYTLAWFDRWLKGPTSRAHRVDAVRRLTATRFDGSADRSAIGAGAWDPVRNANVPHTIAGEPVEAYLSFYYRSSYAFDGLRCEDMRAGCGR